MAFTDVATEQHYNKLGLKALCEAIDTNFALLEAGGAGAVTVDSLVCTAGATFGGGYAGASGATISTAGVGQFNGALTTDGLLTATGGVTAAAIVQINDNVALNFEGVAADVDGLQITCDNAGDAIINCTAGKLTLTTSDGAIESASTITSSNASGFVASGTTLGVSITGAATDGLKVSGDCTDAIELSGTNTNGVNFTGTYTGNVLDFSNATIDPTGSGGPCMIRVGAYGSEVDYGADNHQSGVIRTYTTCSGDISSYDRGAFFCTVTTGAKGAFPVAGLAEANNTGTGPSKLQAGQFIAHLGARSSGAVLATAAGDATAGMYGAWLKVTAAGTANCVSGSKVAAAWIDNQMSGTVSGEEYGLFATTGASRPDAFVGFETSSSGYSQLFYFDETFNSGAGTCATTDAVPGTQDARLLVYYNATQYYIPLYR